MRFAIDCEAGCSRREVKQLVGFADYIIMNYSIKIIIALPPYREQPASQSIFIFHYSLRSETIWLLSYENAIWKPIPTFPIGKELKQQISSLKRKQMVSPFSLEGDGGGYLFSKKMIGFSLMSL